MSKKYYVKEWDEKLTISEMSKRGLTKRTIMNAIEEGDIEECEQEDGE